MTDNENKELSIRIFVCRYCGKVVVAGDDREKKDKRSIFCCSECEKKYWKRGRESRTKRIRTAEEKYEKLKEFINSNKEKL